MNSETRYVLWIGSIHGTVSGFSTGSISRFTTTVSLSLRMITHSSVFVWAGVDFLVRHARSGFREMLFVAIIYAAGVPTARVAEGGNK